MRLPLLAGGVFLALGMSLGLPALANHAEERAAWRALSTRLELGEYDAALSDELYNRSEETRLDAEWAGSCIALSLVLLLAGWTPAKARPLPPHPVRVTLLDGACSWSLLLFALGGESWGWWDSRESALAAAFSSAAVPLFLLPYAPLVAGRSVGLSIAGGGLPTGLSRIRAFLLAPFSFPLLVLTFWARGRFSWLRAVHLPLAPPKERIPASQGEKPA